MFIWRKSTAQPKVASDTPILPVETPAYDSDEMQINVSLASRNRQTDLMKRRKAKKISRKPITKCPHKEAEFYAKGMCAKCYHKLGREKLADKCPHTNRASYVRGICKLCYLKEYHRQKKLQGTQANS